jgi:putative nucleotidyltransferase with HDIG domain
MALTAERSSAGSPSALFTHGLWPEGHLERVAWYSELLAAAAGLDDTAKAIIRTAALVHEIGKLSVPETILHKSGPLTPQEYEEIKRHAIRGAEMCQALPRGAEIGPIVRAHHEHWDGQGYPDGLTGEAIPLGARILAIADAYDTLTMDRPFRRAFPPDEALEILWFGVETQWDRRLVELFERVMRPALFEPVPAA